MALGTFILLATLFYLLDPFSRSLPKSLPSLNLEMTSSELAQRLRQADSLYDKVLSSRKELIKKFGPNPSGVAMFPPNEYPWPAYTVCDLGDGGKWVCGLSRVEDTEDCVVYSVGINGQSSFEAELLVNTKHCHIWGYDFSVKSFGPEITRRIRHRTHFFAYGLAGNDGVTTSKGKEFPMYTLESLMRMNGHTHIDILKVDIESWEFETFATLIKSYMDKGKALPFGQLQLEIHLWDKDFPQFLEWWEMLEEAGLRPFMTEPNLVYANYNRGGSAQLAEYSFINVRSDNIFVKNIAR
ncbi:hypothetical protein D9758_004672 [Tetrapyrgos nigripes]|uniref:Methyltransferase domain-containing protein n=1 Tax=Tetrapyrgos nigripes TaxID=182062 RepID=A0A8H5H092_9AGAR|nr:hypothetical protein D9758_004672 [Tetrapyrgos nigripes]